MKTALVLLALCFLASCQQLESYESRIERTCGPYKITHNCEYSQCLMENSISTTMFDRAVIMYQQCKLEAQK